MVGLEGGAVSYERGTPVKDQVRRLASPFRALLDLKSAFGVLDFFFFSLFSRLFSPLFSLLDDLLFFSLPSVDTGTSSFLDLDDLDLGASPSVFDDFFFDDSPSFFLLTAHTTQTR